MSANAGAPASTPLSAPGTAPMGAMTGMRAAVRALASRPGKVAAALVLGGVLAYLASYFPPELLFEPTTATGGDMASHVLTAQHLRDSLLPNGRLLGWMPGNLAGYPAFQLYFPLPFLAIVALEPLVGLQVAFKLVTVLGTFLLPLLAFAAFRHLGFRRPVPVLAAAFTLPFLMIEANSVWGGNIPSTLAGEFCYSLGLALTVLFVGTAYRGLLEGRWLVVNALLLAAIGLCHAYALLVAGCVSASYLLLLPSWRRGLRYLGGVWGLAFLLLGFWLLPLLGYAPFTSPYRDIWAIDGWRRVIPPVLWPFAGVAVAFTLVLLWRLFRGSRTQPRLESHTAVLWSLVWVSGLLYFAAPHLGAVDIRFLPFLQLGVTLLAAIPAGRLLRRAGDLALAPVAVALATMVWVEAHVDYIPRWIDWNYTGFESKPLWPAFAEVNRRLAGGVGDPRVVFEHTPQHNAAGSIRAFESLPLFSGRSTLEGLYIQSSLNTPQIFYLQSEYSAVASCPLPEYHCGRLDPARAAEHLRQFNVREIVARSAEVKAALARSADFELAAAIPPYEIHRVRGGDDRYVVPLAYEPVLLETSDWKHDAFEWFRRPGASRLTLVHRAPGEAVEAGRFHLAATRLPDEPPLVPLPGGVEVSEEVGQEQILIRTSRPGHPLLVKVSYHPRWRLEDGGPVYLASPGFLLIYPQQSEVRLVFGTGPVDRAGLAMSLLGGVLLAGGVLGSRRRRARARSIGSPRPAGAVERWLERQRRWIVVAPPVLGLLAAGLLAAQRAAEHPAGLYESGLEAYRRGEYALAAEAFDRAQRAGSRSSAALHAAFYRALMAYKLERWQEAAGRFEEMARRYPESIYAAEGRYHVGLCTRRLGREPEARAVFESLRRDFPHTPWAGYAAERLAEPLAVAAASGETAAVDRPPQEPAGLGS